MQLPNSVGAVATAAQEDIADVSGIPVEVAAALLVAGLILYALVNAVEIAIASVNRIRIRHLAEEGSRAARAVQSLLDSQERFFAFIVLLQNVGVVLASTMGGFLAVEIMGGVSGVVAGTIVLTLGIALFGEITPKVLAAHSGERFPLLVAPIVRSLMAFAKPVVVVLAAAPGFFSRLIFGERGTRRASVTEAELRMLIDIGAEEGAVQAEEAELLERVFHFGDRRVNEIMVPRTEVVWLEKGTAIREFYRVFAEHPHSRFPVYERSQDNVVGIVGIKDVLRGVAEAQMTENSPIDLAMRQAIFVPETKFAGTLFFEMQHAGQQMAVVLDEYGGTAGVVTLEMLLEELVGYVSDELRRHEDEFVTVDERTFQIDAGMTIHDANQELELALPEGDYETVAGFVLSQLGRIPKEGEQFTFNGWRIAVTRVLGHKVEEVTVTRL
jgi:CBS domain containing-hemolysin-like protein